MVLAGRARRLALLFSRRFHRDRRSVGDPSDVEYHLSSPWCLASLQDDRRTVEERDLIWQDIEASSVKLCQLDEWFGQVFLRVHSDKDSIASLPEVKAAQKAWSWQVLRTIAPGKYKHGRNRRRSHRDDN